MGPRANYLGTEVPQEELIWQDPIPASDFSLVRQSDINKLKKKILASDLSNPELIRVAWGAASSYRDSDMRGGANGARIALAPQKDWEVNNPEELSKVLTVLRGIQSEFNDSYFSRVKISLADLIVLGGNAAIEK